MTRGLPAVLLLVLASAAACGSGGGSGGGETLTVYAASSLTTVFTELGEDFEAAHDGVTVRLSFGGSSDLVAQVRNGAPADVVATADEATMDQLTGDSLTGAEPRLFATNTLEIVVPPDNPAGIASFQDLAEPGLALVVCAPDVPCGAATLAASEQVGVTLDPVSEEQSVTDVLGKVRSGEADAGLVYVTDVEAAGADVTGIPFPESRSVVNRYPIATVADSAHARLAQSFVDLVLSEDGQQVLAAAGFGRP